LLEDHFIAQDDSKTYVRLRDKDIPAALTRPDRIGFIGSDTFDELTDSAQDGLVYRTIAQTGLRVALLAPSVRATRVQEKLASGETLQVATSYPRAAKRSSGALGCAIRVLATLGGSVEAAPKIYPGIDGVVDIVKTGETARQNCLVVARDDLQPVTLGAVWRESSANTPPLPFEVSGLSEAVGAIERRVTEAAAGEQNSYTQRLAGDDNRLHKKLGEEFAELLGELCTGSVATVQAETADLLYVLAIANAKQSGSLLGALALLASRNTA
jgi:phosphoribosyl-ATP pyrophosphohydrolase